MTRKHNSRDAKKKFKTASGEGLVKLSRRDGQEVVGEGTTGESPVDVTASNIHYQVGFWLNTI